MVQVIYVLLIQLLVSNAQYKETCPEHVDNCSESNICTDCHQHCGYCQCTRGAESCIPSWSSLCWSDTCMTCADADYSVLQTWSDGTGFCRPNHSRVFTDHITTVDGTNFYLLPNDRINSIDNTTYLTFQTDGDLILFYHNEVIWHSNTAGEAIDGYVLFQWDRNLVVHDKYGAPIVGISGVSGGGQSHLVVTYRCVYIMEPDMDRLWYEGDGCNTDTWPTFAPPTSSPTFDPTFDPTSNPTSDPTSDPTYDPTYDPTSDPTFNPTFDPSTAPSFSPSIAPTLYPSRSPSTPPTNAPSTSPTNVPTMSPTLAPSLAPSIAPSRVPSTAPTAIPSNAPTFSPTTCYEFDENNAFSDDGQNEYSVLYQLSNLEFMNAVTNISKIVYASDFYSKTVRYQDNDITQLHCTESGSCLMSNIYFENNDICNVECNGEYSCVGATIIMMNCNRAQLICNNTNACGSAHIEIDANYFNINCGLTTSCGSIYIEIIGNNKIGNISCIDSGACDEAEIIIDSDNYSNVKLNMISHSYNVTFSNGFGYEEINQSARYVECNTNDKYIRYKNSVLTDQQIRDLTLNEYKNDLFPCDGVTIKCWDDNATLLTNLTSKCDMKLTAHTLDLSTQPGVGVAPCYWVQLESVIDISCDGFCKTSPTLDPTPSPTPSPTEPSVHPTTDPTKDPTVDPTVDPTIQPTSHPTFDPTVDPTRDPTKDPTKDPTRDPTIDPTIDPTLDPTIDPTSDPTNPPSFSPSAAPTYSPSISPSNAPTSPPSNAPSYSPSSAPSLSPSIIPTVAPSIAPSQPPTNAPSMAPTQNPSYSPTGGPSSPPTVAPTIAPTFSPTKSPTYSPSTAPTRLPTSTGYLWWVDILYKMENFTLNNIQLISNDSVSFAHDMQQILEENYFDSDLLNSYQQFAVVIQEINDNEIDDIKLDDLYSYKLKKPITLNSTIWCETEQIGWIIIEKTKTKTFISAVESDLRDYFHQNGILFATLNEDDLEPLNEYKAYVPPMDWTIYIISAVVVGLGLMIGIYAFIVNKMANSKVDNAMFLAPILVSFQMYDLISDLNLSFDILKNTSLSTSGVIFWCGISSLTFTVIPFLSNIYYAITMPSQKVIRNNTAASAYFKNHLTEFVLITVFTGGAYPSLALISSRIFALDLFNSGLTTYELNKLSKIKIRSTITLENGPQLITQIIYSSVAVITPATALAFTASLLSVIATLATYYAQSATNKSDDNVVVQYSIYFGLKNNNNVLNNTQMTLMEQRKERKEELTRHICSQYRIPFQSMEIGFVKLTSNGCDISIVHHVFNEQLNAFQRNMKQMTRGYKMQIEPSYYTQKLFKTHSNALTNILCTHFNFMNPERYFVRYIDHQTKDNLLQHKISQRLLGDGQNAHGTNIQMTPIQSNDRVDEDPDLLQEIRSMIINANQKQEMLLNNLTKMVNRDNNEEDLISESKKETHSEDDLSFNGNETDVISNETSTEHDDNDGEHIVCAAATVIHHGDGSHSLSDDFNDEVDDDGVHVIDVDNLHDDDIDDTSHMYFD